MKLDLDGTSVGLVVELNVLRGVITTLNIGGKHWWLVTNPTHAAARGSVTIAHGYEDCYDRFNTLYFETPVVSRDETSWDDPRIFVLIKRSEWKSTEPQLRLKSHWSMRDCIDDLDCAFYPLQNALIERIPRQD
jgi:hypothetical protein